MNDYLKQLYNRFGNLTLDFSFADWRKCRDANYWKADQIIDSTKKLEYKIQCIEDYLQNQKFDLR
jgi:hypothetical protein